MNRNLVLKALGLVLLFEALAMLPPLGISLYYNEKEWASFAACLVFTGLTGGILAFRTLHSTHVGYREGFVIATFGWLSLAVFGCLPYILSSLLFPVDAFFETMSGFTTTGASILSDIESMPKGVLFWRSLTHWLGGIGTIVLLLALIPSFKIAGMQMYRAEVTGPTKTKVLPRIVQTSRELYKVYVIITVAQIVLLKIAGMGWFDSFIHTFGTVATGGFSNRNASVGAYDNFIFELIIVFFIVVCGMNFSLHYHALKGRVGIYWRDTEVRFYLGIIGVSVALIAVNLVSQMALPLGKAFRESLFQVISIMSTTGYATADFDKWPSMSKALLVMLMMVGGCAGSTGGSIKVIRNLILLKSIKRQFMRLIHPQAVIPVRVGRDVVSQEVLDQVHTFFFIYILILAGSAMFISAFGYDLVTSFTAAAANLGNVGPGLGLVGPVANYSAMPDAVKLLLSLDMLVGRLELFTVLVMLNFRFWRSA